MIKDLVSALDYSECAKAALILFGFWTVLELALIFAGAGQMAL